MDEYDISREQCAQVVVKNRRNGLKNPNVRFGAELQLEDVIGSRMMAYPITSQEIRPACDGACALILAKEEKATRLTNKPVWITGVGQSYDVHFLGERELAESLSLEEAAKQAYRMAGVIDPGKELSLVELSEHYAYQELLWTEGLGLCERGGGGKLIDSGATQVGGKMPINASGGVLSGNPRMVAGLVRVIECALQLRGEAGERQVDGASKALAHGTNGPCGQQHCVVLLEKGF
jgi:acetyl-CoA C-acetyltransferase